MTSPGTLSQDVIDAMRDYLRPFALEAWMVDQAEEETLSSGVDELYRGGVSAFIRDHEGRGA